MAKPATKEPGSTPSKRGRPRAGEQAERKAKVLEAAFEELFEHGYERVTMLGIAKRAGSSKETLYSWFGNKEGLFTAMITTNGDESAERVGGALAGDGEPRETLVGYAVGLLMLLTGERSVALNRAAMPSPDLAKILLASGRMRVGPIVETYLARLAELGVIEIESPSEAFTLLYGLTIQDTQIRVLLGDRAPSKAEVLTRANLAVDRFFELTGP